MISLMVLKYLFDNCRILHYRVSNLFDCFKANSCLCIDGKIHNGCVRVDDVGWNFGDNHIDFYVLHKSNCEKLSSLINDHVDIIVNSNCVLQKY